MKIKEFEDLECWQEVRYSRSSTSEVQNCLYIALDQKYITQQILDTIYEQSNKVRQIIDGLIRYLRTKRA